MQQQNRPPLPTPSKLRRGSGAKRNKSRSCVLALDLAPLGLAVCVVVAEREAKKFFPSLLPHFPSFWIILPPFLWWLWCLFLSVLSCCVWCGVLHVGRQNILEACSKPKIPQRKWNKSLVLLLLEDYYFIAQKITPPTIFLSWTFFSLFSVSESAAPC